MAIKISDSRSFKMQPLAKNNWVFQFSAIPGNTSTQAEALAFVAKTCNAPAYTAADMPIDRMNEQYKFAGKISWNDISCTFYDFIRNSSSNSENSAGDILYDWFCMIYNPLTGQMGYKTQYATSASLAQTDPAGNIIRCWNIFGIYPSAVNWGDGLDYSAGGVCEISSTFKYDLAVKVADSHTSTESA
jgi:hypothetical protein